MSTKATSVETRFPTASEANPHTIPEFDRPRSTPLLYLPPLLSSLPEQFPPHPFPELSETPPIVIATRLPSIDPASLHLHKALHHFKPLNPEYASQPYSEAFNWTDINMPLEDERDWYCVVFRSKRKDQSNGDSLYEADKNAHEEAVKNGGLIMYWYGIPNTRTGMNLATCIWQSKRHAIAANSRPRHLEAMKLALTSYDTYQLERYVLKKLKGESGVSVEPYISGEAGW